MKQCKHLFVPIGSWPTGSSSLNHQATSQSHIHSLLFSFQLPPALQSFYTLMFHYHGERDSPFITSPDLCNNWSKMAIKHCGHRNTLKHSHKKLWICHKNCCFPFPPLLFVVSLLLWVFGVLFNVKSERKEDEKQWKSRFIANPTVGRGVDKAAPWGLIYPLFLGFHNCQLL